MPTVGPRARDLAAGRVRPTEDELTDPHRSPVHRDLPLVRPRTPAEDRAHLAERSEARRRRDAIAARPNLP
jgi:hypothetical protein